MYKQFMQSIFPLLLDIGRIVCMCSLFSGAISVTRRETGEGTEKLKAAAIGYIILRLLGWFIRLLDGLPLPK